MKLRALLGVAVIGVLGMANIATTAGAANPPTQYFTGIQMSTSSGAQTVVAAGPISAKGTDTELGQTADRFTFPKGSIMLKHHGGKTNQHHDPRTCSFEFDQTGTYTITSGNGAYKHASGNGTYRIHGIGTQCNDKSGSSNVAVTVELQGSLTFG
ncbi:MAG TPA: hypothetical protein VGO03_13705 [Acidimicrobiia bacterium]